jgi:hypothetical protein
MNVLRVLVRVFESSNQAGIGLAKGWGDLSWREAGVGTENVSLVPILKLLFPHNPFFVALRAPLSLSQAISDSKS